MRSIFRLALTAIIISAVFVPAVAAVAAGEKTSHDEKAVELLREFSKTLADAKAIKTTLTLSSFFKADRRTQKSSGTFTVAIRRPDKLAWVLRRGNGITAKSDGEKLFTLAAQLKKFTEKPAPESLAGANDFSMPLDGMGKGGVAEMLLADDPYAAITDGADKISYNGSVVLQGSRCHKIIISKEDRDLFIYLHDDDKKLPLIIKYDMSRLVAKGYAKGVEPSKVKAEVTAKFNKWELDTDIPDQTFKFKAPANVRKVNSFSKSSDKNRDPLVGQAAPDFKLEMLDGRAGRLSEHKGRNIVILDFWATWCGPCRRGLPAMIEVAKKYADRDVLLYAVNQQESPKQIKKFLQDNNLNMPVALDPDGRRGDLFGVDSIPRTIVIDKNGTIQAVHRGFGSGTKAQLQKELDAIIAGNGPADE